MSHTESGQYVMGHQERERRRLALQGSILNPFTEELLRRAGIARGMRVLDLGCGIGDVSLMASRLVGSHGHVVAIDIDGASVSTAQERARTRGLQNVRFLQSAVEEYRAGQLFDAVTGRHILMHGREPLDLLRSAWENLRDGGVAVFQEFDFSVIQPGYPATPFRDELMRICRDFFCRATHGNMGTRLYHLFLQSGFAAPDCRVEYPVDGGPDSPFYDWCAESVRSIYPHLETLGIVHKDQLNLDTLAQQLRDEVVRTGACFAAPMMVGGFARKR